MIPSKGSAQVILARDMPEVVRLMEHGRVSGEGIRLMNKKALFRVIRVGGLDVRAANILKQEMLSKGGDAAVHAGVVNCRQQVSDVILMGTLRQYRRVIKSLRIQPVGLPKLAEKLKTLLDPPGGQV